MISNRAQANQILAMSQWGGQDMEKCMLQKLAEARCEPNEDQVNSKNKAIEAQAAKKSFIEEMMQPAALAVISVVSQRLQHIGLAILLMTRSLESSAK